MRNFFRVTIKILLVVVLVASCGEFFYYMGDLGKLTAPQYKYRGNKIKEVEKDTTKIYYDYY